MYFEILGSKNPDAPTVVLSLGLGGFARRLLFTSYGSGSSPVCVSVGAGCLNKKKQDSPYDVVEITTRNVSTRISGSKNTAISTARRVLDH